ncbi:MAG: hypothetical protein ACK8QZ_02480, partial [Anaerolineales bacterium]
AAVYDECFDLVNKVQIADCSSTGWHCGYSTQCSSGNYTGCRVGTVGNGQCSAFPVPSNLPSCGTGVCSSMGICYQRSVICCDERAGIGTKDTTLCPADKPYHCGDNCTYNQFCSSNCGSGGGGGGGGGGNPTVTPASCHFEGCSYSHPGYWYSYDPSCSSGVCSLGCDGQWPRWLGDDVGCENTNNDQYVRKEQCGAICPGPWVKLKDASFTSNKALVNHIPKSLAYDVGQLFELSTRYENKCQF